MTWIFAHEQAYTFILLSSRYVYQQVEMALSVSNLEDMIFFMRNVHKINKFNMFIYIYIYISNPSFDILIITTWMALVPMWCFSFNN